MPSIEQDLRQIRKAVYGREVREAIADGIEKCYQDVEGATEAADHAVRYDIAQNLTDAQKLQARENIGAATGAVRYDIMQTLTEAQMEQARFNIGAATINEETDGILVIPMTLLPHTNEPPLPSN